jgi:hypothetical protein
VLTPEEVHKLASKVKGKMTNITSTTEVKLACHSDVSDASVAKTLQDA